MSNRARNQKEQRLARRLARAQGIPYTEALARVRADAVASAPHERSKGSLTLGKRVNVDGPGDDPSEYWFECHDCKGTGRVSIPDFDEDENGGVYVEATCPGCDGRGVYEGEADDIVTGRVGTRNIPETGWTEEGAAWLDSLDREDLLFLEAAQDDPRAEGHEERLTRLRQSYESATGETWK